MRKKTSRPHLCSTGEQKALLTGLVLAHARLVAQTTGITPFLLLDEIAAHFDPARREALFSALGRLDAQCWMTGTDTLLFEAWGDPGAMVWRRSGQRASESLIFNGLVPI